MMYGNILTGGISTGKSTVSNILKLEGFNVIDADNVAHNILDTNASLVTKYFGEEILTNGKINRAILGKIVFDNKDKKELLESILHPLIYDDIMQKCEVLESKQKPYFMDIPLYFESKYEYRARYIICVYASKDLQLQRLMKRNNLSKQDALKRIESQIDIDIKKQKSDFVIENTGDLKTLQKNIESFLCEFRSIYKI